MNLSKFYARWIGLYLLILPVGILLKPESLQNLISQMNNASTLVSFGIFGLIIGLAIVASHQIWKGWPIIITLLGYWTVIKGILILFYPEWVMSIAHTALHENNLYIGIGVDLTLGLILLYCGFKSAIFK